MDKIRFQKKQRHNKTKNKGKQKLANVSQVSFKPVLDLPVSFKGMQPNSHRDNNS